MVQWCVWHSCTAFARFFMWPWFWPTYWDCVEEISHWGLSCVHGGSIFLCSIFGVCLKPSWIILLKLLLLLGWQPSSYENLSTSLYSLWGGRDKFIGDAGYRLFLQQQSGSIYFWTRQQFLLGICQNPVNVESHSGE